MALKTLNGGALISYGGILPAGESTPDGALFYKTDGLDGTPSGLYMFGFIKDADTGILGFQSSQTWQQVLAADGFVKKSGDIMTGVLTVPNYIKVSGTGSQRLIINSIDGSGNNKPSILSSQNGVLTIGIGNTNNTDGGTLSSGLSIDASSASTGLQWFNQQVWTAQNDGAGSTLDADLLDGEQGAFYRSASNINTGILPLTVGGTGNNTAAIVGGIAYGSSTSKISFSVLGTQNWLFQSNGSNAPSWVNPSTLSVASAVTANTANSALTAGTATSATNATNAASATSATLAVKASTLASNGANGRALTFDSTDINNSCSFIWGSNDGTLSNLYRGGSITVGGANKLTTPRTITFQGGVQGAAQFDGTQDIVINTAINSSGSNTVFPAGMVAFFAGNTAPAGWVIADGTTLNRATYPALWAWGIAQSPVSETDWIYNGYFGRFSVGDNSTNFRIPDLRGMFLRSLDNGRGFDINRELGRYQAPAVVYHEHPVYDPGHVHGVIDQQHTHGAGAGVAGYHGHNVSDPGHSHSGGSAQNTGGVNYASSGPNPVFQVSNTGASATGIGIVPDGAHGHDITIAAAYSNVGATATGYTGYVVGGVGPSDGRPANIAYILCIKY